MAYDFIKPKGMVLDVINFSFRLLTSFINIGLTFILVLGAISAFMLLIFMFPEKALPISNLFMILLELIWNLIKVLMILLFIFVLIYIFILYYELFDKLMIRRKQKRNKFIKDLVKEMKLSRNKK